MYTVSIINRVNLYWEIFVMKILYFDCFSGISGDMTLGSLLDLGVSSEYLKNELDKLNLHGYEIKVSKKLKNGIMATDVDIIIEEQHNHRTFNDIKEIILSSELSDTDKELSIKIFQTLAEVEGKIHGKSIDKVHFHEVSAVDSIIDIVGAAICFNKLGIDKVVCSSLNIGMGTIICEHGIIPAPATLELIKQGGIPVYTTDVNKEIVTPIGVAIVSVLADEFGAIPKGVINEIGYGAGKKNMEMTNVLRTMIIEDDNSFKKNSNDEVFVVEANIDDMNGEIAGYAMEKLLNEGALDVFYTAIQMKKNRPGVKLTVICNIDKVEKVKDIILSETTTIGIRYYKVRRECMNREFKEINTPYGKLTIKISSMNNIKKVMPEYEVCKELAIKNNVPIREIYNCIDKYN